MRSNFHIGGLCFLAWLNLILEQPWDLLCIDFFFICFVFGLSFINLFFPWQLDLWLLLLNVRSRSIILMWAKGTLYALINKGCLGDTLVACMWYNGRKQKNSRALEKAWNFCHSIVDGLAFMCFRLSWVDCQLIGIHELSFVVTRLLNKLIWAEFNYCLYLNLSQHVCVW